MAVKSKNGGLKQIAASSGVSAIFAGVTEPGLYGVTMPLKRPLAAVCISSGITGLIAGIMNVSASSFASPSLLALPIFVNAERADNFLMACICAGISIVLSFIATWIIGFEDPKAETKEDASQALTERELPSNLRKEKYMRLLTGKCRPFRKAFMRWACSPRAAWNC